MRRYAVAMVTGLLLACGLAGCGGPNVAWTVGSALSKARQTNQLVLVEFWGLGVTACSEMDRKVYTDPMVRHDLEEFVRVRVDYGLNRRMAGDLQVTGVPGFAAVRPDGSLIASSTGPMDADGLRRFLIRAKIFR